MATLVKFFIIFLFSQLLNAQIVSGQNITVKVNNLDSNKGKVFVAIYDSEDSFLGTQFKGTISEINENSCEVVFENVPQGVYAISLFHDAMQGVQPLNKPDKVIHKRKTTPPASQYIVQEEPSILEDSLSDHISLELADGEEWCHF